MCVCVCVLLVEEGVLLVLSVLVEEGVLVAMCVNRGGQTRSGSTLVVGWVLVMVHTHNVAAMVVLVEVDGARLGMVVW